MIKIGPKYNGNIDKQNILTEIILEPTVVCRCYSKFLSFLQK